MKFGIALLLLFSNPLLSNQSLLFWESKTIEAVEIEAPYDIGIVLGGYSENRHKRPNGGVLFNLSGPSSNRLTQAIELYKLGKVKKLMLSGGAANLMGDRTSESFYSNRFLLRMGIPPEDIILESSSRNTYENALFSKNILAKTAVKNQEKILLITSAFHMYRAKKCFDKVGLKTTPFSVNFYGNNKSFSLNEFIPSVGAISNWQMLIKEWVGLVAYKLSNKI